MSLKKKHRNSEVSLVLSTVKIRLFPFDSCLIDIASVTLARPNVKLPVAREGNLSSKTLT